METLDIPAEMSVTLRMDETMRDHLRGGASALAVAHAFEVDDAEMAQLANEELRSIKGAAAKLEEFRKQFIAPAQQIIANARALFDPALRALGEAESVLKGKMVTYQQAEDRKAAEARAKAEAEARIARQRAEAEAAAARARAEEQAREARRQAEEAEAVRRKAEAEGNAKAAAAAAAARAKAEEAAAAAVENGEAKAQQAVMAAAAAPVVMPSAPAKIAGFSMRDNWTAALASGVTEPQAIALIAHALPTRPELIALLKLDVTAASKMAKALKGAFNVPGLSAENNQVAAVRK